MSRVFIPQVPSRFDTTINAWVPTVSINAAREFGEIKVMLPPEASRLDPEDMVKLLRVAMDDYGEDDYILALGNPIIIAIAAVLADRAASPLRMLQWDKVSRNYQLMEARLDDDEGGASQ
jgi:hypothetical protein